MADQTNMVAFKTNQTYNRTENKSCHNDGRSNKQGGIQNKPDIQQNRKQKLS